MYCIVRRGRRSVKNLRLYRPPTPRKPIYEFKVFLEDVEREIYVQFKYKTYGDKFRESVS